MDSFQAIKREKFYKANWFSQALQPKQGDPVVMFLYCFSRNFTTLVCSYCCSSPQLLSRSREEDLPVIEQSFLTAGGKQLLALSGAAFTLLPPKSISAVTLINRKKHHLAGWITQLHLFTPASRGW